jgi:uncharacterized membrane protein
LYGVWGGVGGLGGFWAVDAAVVRVVLEVLAEAGAVVPRAAAREAAGDMKARHFLSELEHARIHGAVRDAETGTSGDIVVFITHKAVPEALAAAQEVFTRRHLQKAIDDNSLLIFLAPKSQTFAVVGGKALHARVGQAWWDDLAKLLHHHFRVGAYTDGLVEAIEKAGEALKRYFPVGKVDRKGQSDIVEE